MDANGLPASLERLKNELDYLKHSLQVKMGLLTNDDDVQLFINARPITIKPLTPLE